MNVSDAERIIQHLENTGYKQTPTMQGADLIVVVACSVRQSAIDRIFGLKKKLLKLRTQNLKLKTILTGCILKSDKPKFKRFFDAVLNIKDFFTYHLFSDRTKDGIDYLELKAKHSNPKSAFVPIMTGCNNFCSYCAVPYTRGREISRSAKNIIREIKGLIKQKYKEIILLGQNVNSYKDNKINFPKLLKMIAKIPGNFTIKFLTSHPKDLSDELINVIAESPKISKEIHLPTQSGNNEILKKMNRGYTAEKYLDLIKKIRAKIPEVKITTDVIVGFPGETKKQFENTIDLFKKINFSMAYINKYSVRPGTAAARLKDNVPLAEKKRRWKILEKLANPPSPSGLRRGKLIVVLGPTASGKSSFAVKLARKINGEVVSADSRQIYKEMDIGTGKISKKEMQGIPHYCLDIASPKRQLTVTEYREKALETIDKIYKKGKTPILCGGTGFYIRAVAEGLVIPEIKPDWKLRKELEKKGEKELFKQLKKLDPQRAKTIDAKNKRRLIRALEIIIKTGRPVPKIKQEPQFQTLYIGIKKSPVELKKLINKRVDKMIKMGLEKEVKALIKKYGQTIVLKNTIGYKEWFKCKNKNQAIEAIKANTYNYAKRQMTWFKQNKKINWI